MKQFMGFVVQGISCVLVFEDGDALGIEVVNSLQDCLVRATAL